MTLSNIIVDFVNDTKIMINEPVSARNGLSREGRSSRGTNLEGESESRRDASGGRHRRAREHAGKIDYIQTIGQVRGLDL